MTGRDQLVEANLRLVDKVAWKVKRSLPRYVDIDDLKQDGVLGLIAAAEKYDQTHCSFATYAEHRIRGAILDGLRGSDWASRFTRYKMNRIEAAEARLKADDRATDVQAISQETGIPAAEISRIRVMARPTRRPIPFNAVDPARTDAGCLAADCSRIMAEAIRTLPDRQRTMVEQLYFADEPPTMREIAETMGVVESRISQIHKNAMGHLRKFLEERNIQSPFALAA